MSRPTPARAPQVRVRGMNIAAAKYEPIRRAIVAELKKTKEATFSGLLARVEARLKGKFEGSVSWYYTMVKRDLEDKGIIKRVPWSKPQRIILGR